MQEQDYSMKEQALRSLRELEEIVDLDLMESPAMVEVLDVQSRKTVRELCRVANIAEDNTEKVKCFLQLPFYLLDNEERVETFLKDPKSVVKLKKIICNGKFELLIKERYEEILMMAKSKWGNNIMNESECVICFGNEEDVVMLCLIPCKNKHSDHICNDCQVSIDKCPICRADF